VIAPLELARRKADFLGRELALEQLKASRYANQIQQAGYQRQIDELQQGVAAEGLGLSLGLQEAWKQLEATLAQWKRQFLLVAPHAGEVALAQTWAENQYVQAGQVVMSLVPEGGRIVGRAYLPLAGAGKVQVGQAVNLKLDHYNAERYGMLRGKVQAISPIPVEESYLLEIELTQGLTTTFGQKLTFQPEMSGVAEVITDDLRLWDRIFIQLRRVLDQKTTSDGSTSSASPHPHPLHPLPLAPDEPHHVEPLTHLAQVDDLPEVAPRVAHLPLPDRPALSVTDDHREVIGGELSGRQGEGALGEVGVDPQGILF